MGDLRCRRLRSAVGAETGRRWPAIVLTGPFTGVKEQVTGSYAELLAAAGFATLAFDHRGFGESGGRRQHEDSQGKLADLRAAVSALTGGGRPGPDRVGGICLGGGYAIRAARKTRVRAVAGIAATSRSRLRHAPVPLSALAERGHEGIAALADDP